MTNIVKLVIYPDIRLKTKSTDVENFDDALRHTLSNMQKATQVFRGIGIAGVQIGYMKRVLYINHDDIVTYENKRNNTDAKLMNAPLYMVNPKILDKSSETFSSSEACLSLPSLDANVTRSKYVSVEYQDEFGNSKTMATDVPLLAACIQHEIDHVDGITIAEHQSILKRNLFSKKIAKFIKLENPTTQIDLDNICLDDGCGHDHSHE